MNVVELVYGSDTESVVPAVLSLSPSEDGLSSFAMCSVVMSTVQDAERVANVLNEIDSVVAIEQNGCTVDWDMNVGDDFMWSKEQMVRTWMVSHKDNWVHLIRENHRVICEKCHVSVGYSDIFTAVPDWGHLELPFAIEDVVNLENDTVVLVEDTETVK